MRRIVQWLLVAMTCAAAVGCSRTADTPQLKELQRVRSGAIDVLLLARDRSTEDR